MIDVQGTMRSTSIFSNLVRADDGTFCTSYRKAFLQSALQPIFRRNESGAFVIDSVEGLVRASHDGAPCPPAQFFASVAKDDMGLIDSMLRTIHILNTGRLGRPGVRVFVNFTPGLYRTEQDVKQEADRIRIATHEAGMSPGQIVCEISEKSNSSRDLPVFLVDQLRDSGFRIAVDDYGAGDSDIERVKRLKPDYVKFEAGWVRESMTSSAGAGLMRMLVERFQETGIETVFPGLEELWQLDLTMEIGVALMQGYVLARPELAPTTFNERFPEGTSVAGKRPEQAPPAFRTPAGEPRPALGGLRPAKTFGRRATQ